MKAKQTKTVAVKRTKQIVISKTEFTASDMKNHMFNLALQVAQPKGTEPTRVNASIGAMRAILATIALEVKAAKLGIQFK